MNCNAIVIWWYENSSNALLPSMFEEKYVITLSFTLMEYIKNGNWIEFNNIMLDTLIFTRRKVGNLWLLFLQLFIWARSTHFNYILQSNNGTKETKKERSNDFLHEFELMKGRT